MTEGSLGPALPGYARARRPVERDGEMLAARSSSGDEELGTVPHLEVSLWVLRPRPGPELGGCNRYRGCRPAVEQCNPRVLPYSETVPGTRRGGHGALARMHE